MSLVRRECQRLTPAGRTTAWLAANTPLRIENNEYPQHTRTVIGHRVPGMATAGRTTTKHGARPSTTEAEMGPAGPGREAARREGVVRGLRPLLWSREKSCSEGRAMWRGVVACAVLLAVVQHADSAVST